MRLDRAKIELAMGTAGLRQRDLADAMGVTDARVSQILAAVTNGDDIRPEIAGRLARAIGHDLIDIVVEPVV